MKRSDISLIWGAIFLLLVYGASIAIFLVQGITHTPITDTGITLPTTYSGIVIQTPVSTVIKLFTFPIGIFIILMYLIPVLEYIRDIVEDHEYFESLSQNIQLTIYICLGILLPTVLYCCATLLIPHMGMDISLLKGLQIHLYCMYFASFIALGAVIVTYLRGMAILIMSKKKE